ncbi:hypothetical protein [Simplicispira lacusdiani]|uniref:hypothetical protein n=1 Tax=Simplicispira lacusdiani TaxID=2213010 RepID=UPI000E7432E2|nr:hypothetical protein [Simplicispira lacusdiani]
MATLQPGERVVREGTFLYDLQIECDVRIVYSPIHYGTGDWEDPPEIQNDLEQDTYYVQYGSTTERGRFNAGGGGHRSLPEAMAAAEAAPGIGPTVRWLGPSANDA